MQRRAGGNRAAAVNVAAAVPVGEHAVGFLEYHGKRPRIPRMHHGIDPRVRASRRHQHACVTVAPAADASGALGDAHQYGDGVGAFKVLEPSGAQQRVGQCCAVAHACRAALRDAVNVDAFPPRALSARGPHTFAQRGHGADSRFDEVVAFESNERSKEGNSRGEGHGSVNGIENPAPMRGAGVGA